MKKILVMLFVFVALLVGAASANSMMSFRIGPSFNFFGDSRLSGIGTGFAIGFDLDKFTAGYKTEQQNLNVVDAQNSANSFQLSNQLNLLFIEKDVPNLPNTFIGMELGSARMIGLTGTVAAPGGISQMVPIVGLNGGLKYENVGKMLTTAMFVSLGYRFFDLTDTAAGTFTAGGATFKDLNSVRLELGVSLQF